MLWEESNNKRVNKQGDFILPVNTIENWSNFIEKMAEEVLLLEWYGKGSLRK